MNKVKPYVYQIRFVKTGQKYVGVRYGNKVPANKDFWNHYFTSSKVVKSLIDEHSKDSFVIEWIKEFDTQKEAIDYEHQCLVENNVGMNDDWLNLHSMYPLSREEYEKIMLEKYGVEYYFQTNEYKEKKKQTNLEKYGFVSSSKHPEVKEKKKQTNLEKYGVEYYTQTDEYKEKMKQTHLEKHGVEYYVQTDEFKEKKKQTNIEKYGVDNPAKLDEVKQKKKQTNIEKYGVEHYTQTDEYKEKSKQTCLERYGVDHVNKAKVKCDECGHIANPSHMSRHQKNTGHQGKTILKQGDK